MVQSRKLPQIPKQTPYQASNLKTKITLHLNTLVSPRITAHQQSRSLLHIQRQQQLGHGH